MVKRFIVGRSENQDTIFDEEGVDDYYHLGNDTRDVIDLCKLLNELHEENLKLKKDNSRLITETADTIAEHQRQILDLIDNKINYYIYQEKWYKHKGKNKEASVFNLYCLCLNNLKKELSE